ncbi:MAG: acyl-CoA dehydrogenase family protein [Pseudomonadales bacterium]|nr:acyl-CoA dehydrogenase family protein [Pseudomonadales bacterium]
MDLSLSVEHSILRDSVERFVRQSYPFNERRNFVDENKSFLEENWQKFSKLGWLGLNLPEEFGGNGGSAVDTMVVAEALGPGLILEPFLETVVIGSKLIQLGYNEKLKSEFLSNLVGGRLILTFAFAEPQSRYSLSDVQLSAKPNEDQFVLNGKKAVVRHASSADKIIVSARTAGGRRDKRGITLFLVERNNPGLSRRDYRLQDDVPASELIFDNVFLSRTAMIGDLDCALPIVELVVDHGIAMVCAEAVGIMSALYTATLQYVKTREQFGQPIGKFQVIKHRMVDMLMACEEARSMAYMATLKLDESDPNVRKRAASAAKVCIGKAARFVGQQSIQLHGGIGMTDELDVGHYFKRLTMIDILFGDVDFHLRRYSACASD